jgi:DNA-binding protein YbaB
MPDRKPRLKRSTPRVTGEGKASTTTKPAVHRGSSAAPKAGVKKLYHTPEGGYYEVVGQASELVPVAQYANVTIGPVAIKRVVIIPDEENLSKDQLQDALKAALQEVQEVCEEVCAEDRETVLEEVRNTNEREKNAKNGK